MPVNFSPEWLMIFYIANQILSAAIQSMNPPTTESGAFYTFLYKFLSLLIADFKSFAAQKKQSTQTTTVVPIDPSKQSGVL